MATHLFRGDAPVVKQVTTVAVTGFDAATTYLLTINGKSIRSAGVTNADGTAAALAAAWNASTIPEFAEVTASASGSTVTLTGDSEAPFVVSSSVSGGSGTIGSPSTTTVAEGPSHWIAKNFSSGSLPASGDTVILENHDGHVRYGLNQSAVTGATLRLRASFTGQVGLPRWNANGYVEYRERYLRLGATTVEVGGGSGTGSGLIRLDLGSGDATITVHRTGTPIEQEVHPLAVKGTGTNNALTALGGAIDVAPFGGEVATLKTVRAAGSARVRCSAGVTLNGSGATVQAGGSAQLDFDSAGLALTLEESSRAILRDGAWGTINAYGSRLEKLGAGTITTLAARTELDASTGAAPFTVTNSSFGAGTTIRDPQGRITFANPYACDGCRPSEITHEGKTGATVLVA